MYLELNQNHTPYERAALPLGHTPKWCRESGSDRRTSCSSGRRCYRLSYLGKNIPPPRRPSQCRKQELNLHGVAPAAFWTRSVFHLRHFGSSAAGRPEIPIMESRHMLRSATDISAWIRTRILSVNSRLPCRLGHRDSQVLHHVRRFLQDLDPQPPGSKPGALSF